MRRRTAIPRFSELLAVRSAAAGRGLLLCAVGLAAGAALAAGPSLLLYPLFQDSPQPGELDGLWPWTLLLGAVLLPTGLWAVRRLAGLARHLVGRWAGTPIETPYRPRPRLPEASTTARLRVRSVWLLTDPANWRDLAWTALTGCASVLLLLAPTSTLLTLLSPLAQAVDGPHTGMPQVPKIPPVAPVPGTAPVHHGQGLLHSVSLTQRLSEVLFAPLHGGAVNVHAWPVLLLVALLSAATWFRSPQLLARYGRLAHALLGPTGQAELALRVRHLAETRSDTIDSGAAELRRIERDLHDGAQARLVAMGMALDAADNLVESSPAAARALLAEARESSVKALAELRDLVRGIHPPVLADRGLADAVHALALDLPMRIHFAGELAGRPPSPVESAAYFTVSELLANVTRHSGATQAWIDLSHSDGMLRIGVGDDGRGSADPARGTGLRGLERRLAAFDGVLAVSSPPGGPTLVNMEIPCALSSPKTSSC